MPASSTRDRVALSALALTAMAVVLASAPYKAFDLDRYFIPKELVLHGAAAIAAIAVLAGCRRLTLTTVDWLLAGFLAASTVSAAGATNLWAAERALAISVSGVLLFWTAGALRRSGDAPVLLVALSLSVVVAAATALAQAYGAQTDLFSVNRAPGGTFGNRNFIAHYVTIGTPVVALTALTARRGLGSVCGGIAIATISAALVMSRSRAAWLAVLVLAVVTGGLAFLTRVRWRQPTTMRRLLVMTAAAVVGTVAAVALPNRLEWKSESPYLESATGLVNYKEGSGRGRIVQYTNSLRMIESNPLLGVGPGNWPVEYPRYASRNDPSMSLDDGVTANPWPSSDWVAMLSERGLVGTGFLIAALVLLVVRTLVDLQRGQGRDGERVLTAIALIGTIIAAVIVGAFDAVLLLAAPTFLFWTLAGALAPPATSPARDSAGIRVWGTAAVLVFGAIAVGRSGTQLGAMSTVNASTHIASLSEAAQFDPGNYRIRLRLAQAYLARGDCARARTHARAARELFPSAAEPKHVLAACGSRS
jgi:O-antigen ligase